MRSALAVWPSVAVLWGLGLVACNPPLPRIELPTLMVKETYNSRILNLRTTLGRGGIGLRVAGFDTTFSTACDDDLSVISGCARCDLAGEATPMDGAVIEAATRAFGLYPATVLAATNLDAVAVCTDIQHTKASKVERPAGLADLQGRRILLSVKRFLNDDYASHGSFTVDDIAHHEVFHALEYALMRTDMFSDAEWNLHNPLGFEYAASNFDEERRPGFVNQYAMTDVAEDKASTYEMIMVHPDEVCELAKTDETIRIKTKIIYRRMLRAVGTDSFMRAAAPCVDWLD